MNDVGQRGGVWEGGPLAGWCSSPPGAGGGTLAVPRHKENSQVHVLQVTAPQNVQVYPLLIRGAGGPLAYPEGSTPFRCCPCPRSGEPLGLSVQGTRTPLHRLMLATGDPGNTQEMPVPTPFSPCPSAALSPCGDGDTHIPKRVFRSFYRKRQLYRHIYTDEGWESQGRGQASPCSTGGQGRQPGLKGSCRLSCSPWWDLLSHNQEAERKRWQNHQKKK